MKTALPETVEHWKLERLIPHARNARTHSEQQVAQIAGSIAEFGFVNPVLVGDDGVIVAGHGRVMAARKLGLSDVPVIVLSHLTPTQRRALMIADNQLTLGGAWNDEMLAAELAALEELAIDPRAFDFLHPAASRPNYLFGLWDPARIDEQGRYRRMVVQQATLDGVLSWPSVAVGESALGSVGGVHRQRGRRALELTEHRVHGLAGGRRDEGEQFLAVADQ